MRMTNLRKELLERLLREVVNQNTTSRSCQICGGQRWGRGGGLHLSETCEVGIAEDILEELTDE